MNCRHKSYRRNMDETLRQLRRAAEVNPSDEHAQVLFQTALARAEGHEPSCDYIRFYLNDERYINNYRQRVESYTNEWPDYCKQCLGWGGQVSRYDPSPAGVSLGSGFMEDYDSCSCVESGRCPRCGQNTAELTDAEDHFYCTNCNWIEGQTEGLPGEEPYHSECSCQVDYRRNPDRNCPNLNCQLPLPFHFADIYGFLDCPACRSHLMLNNIYYPSNWLIVGTN